MPNFVPLTLNSADEQNRRIAAEADRSSRLRNMLAEQEAATNFADQEDAKAAYLAATPQQADVPPPAGSPAPPQNSGLAAQMPIESPQTITRRPPIPPSPAQIPQQAAAAMASQPGFNVEQSLPPGVAGINQSAAPAAPGGAQQQNILSPFDTPEYNRLIAERAANRPAGSGGKTIMALKADRDKQVAGVMEMISNGHADEARHVAQRNGIQIPENLFQNADIARAMAFSQKAYPNESDKGHVFYQAFIQTQGDMMAKVNAGIAAAGRPENTAQRELQKAMALALFNNNLPPKSETFVGENNTIYQTNPRAGTASPIIDATTGKPFQGRPKSVSGGRGLGMTQGQEIDWIKKVVNDSMGAITYDQAAKMLDNYKETGSFGDGGQTTKFVDDRNMWEKNMPNWAGGRDAPSVSPVSAASEQVKAITGGQQQHDTAPMPSNQIISIHGGVPPAQGRVPGTVYNTPKGKLKWTGTGWVQP